MAPSLYAVRASNFGRPRDGHERGSPGFPSTPCLNDSCRNDESIEWTRYWVRSLRIWSIRISDDREHRPTMTGQLAVPVMLEKRESRLTLLAVSPVPPWPPLDGMALRVSRLLQELSAHWSIVLICPRGGESATENGITLTGHGTGQCGRTPPTRLTNVWCFRHTRCFPSALGYRPQSGRRRLINAVSLSGGRVSNFVLSASTAYCATSPK